MPALSLPPACRPSTRLRAFGIAILCATAVCTIAGGASAQSSAIYEVAFRGTWSVDDHDAGQPLPNGAHFTGLFGATHPPGMPLWEAGGFATLGVEVVAEAGVTLELRAEVEALIEDDEAGEIVSAMELPRFPRTRREEFVASVPHSSVSVLSMIAPSPDWFVGASDVALRDENGWLDEVVVELHPYDAGTEDGSGFSLMNAISTPIETISRRGAPFAEGASLGTLTFSFVPEAGGFSSGLVAVALLGAMRRRARADR